MAEKSVQRDVTIIDPMFAIPEGVDELAYDEGTIEVSDDVYSSDENLADDYVNDDYADGDSYEEYDDEPETPGIVGVVSEVLRTTTAGTQVVDLVIEVEDIPGAINYEVRVTKA